MLFLSIYALFLTLTVIVISVMVIRGRIMIDESGIHFRDIEDMSPEECTRLVMEEL